MAGFSNPLVGGGGALVYPSIHSPGFVSGSTGWSIDKNGDAEFDDVIIRGTFMGLDWEITSAGIFTYNGTPALGNLLATIAPASGTDSHGNAYEAGVVAYVTVSGSVYAIQLGNLNGPVTGFAAMTVQNLTSPATEPAAVLARVSASGCTLEVYSGISTGAASPAALALEDSVQTGANPAAAFSANTNVTAGSFNGVPLAQEAHPTYTGSAAGNPPGSGGTVAGSFNGNALSYLTAFATDFNALRTAYLSLVAQLQATGVLS